VKKRKPDRLKSNKSKKSKKDFVLKQKPRNKPGFLERPRQEKGKKL